MSLRIRLRLTRTPINITPMMTPNAIQNHCAPAPRPGFLIVFAPRPLVGLLPESSVVPLLELLSPLLGVFPAAVPGVPLLALSGRTALPFALASLLAAFAGFALPGSA